MSPAPAGPPGGWGGVRGGLEHLHANSNDPALNADGREREREVSRERDIERERERERRETQSAEGVRPYSLLSLKIDDRSQLLAR